MNANLRHVIGLTAFLVSNMGYAVNQISFGEVSAAPIGVSITKIADDNPNPPPGTFKFTRFSYPAISGDEVGFPSQLQGGPIFQLGIFTSLGGSISQVDGLNFRYGADFFNLSLSDGTFAYTLTASAGPARVATKHIRVGGSNGTVTDVASVITSSAANECQGDLGAPSVSEGVVAFREVITLASPNCNTPPPGDAIYIYDSNVSGGSSPEAVVTQDDSVPGGTSKFTSFGDTSISGNLIAFVGRGSNGESGIYTNNINAMSQLLSVAADINTSIPNGTGSFVGFGTPSLNGNKVAFLGFGSNGQQGIYTAIEEGVNLVADTNTPVPNRTGTFTSFGDPVLSGNLVAFFGSDGNSEGGIYIVRKDVKYNPVLKVIDTSDILDGKTIARLSFGHGGLSGNQLAFLANFSDGSSGIYKAEITTSKDQCKKDGYRKFHFVNQGLCIQFVNTGK